MLDSLSRATLIVFRLVADVCLGCVSSLSLAPNNLRATLKNQVQLITYVDRLSGGGLSELRALLNGRLRGVFGGVHLLPIFQSQLMVPTLASTPSITWRWTPVLARGKTCVR